MHTYSKGESVLSHRTITTKKQQQPEQGQLSYLISGEHTINNTGKEDTSKLYCIAIVSPHISWMSMIAQNMIY